MAVTRTIAELAVDLRIGDGATEPTGADPRTCSRASAGSATGDGAPGMLRTCSGQQSTMRDTFRLGAVGCTTRIPSGVESWRATSLERHRVRLRCSSPYKIRRGGLIG